MTYNIFLIYDIIVQEAYNLQLKQIQSTVFPLPYQSTLGDKIIFKFISDHSCRVFALCPIMCVCNGWKVSPLHPFAVLLWSDFYFDQNDLVIQ